MLLLLVPRERRVPGYTGTGVTGVPRRKTRGHSGGRARPVAAPTCGCPGQRPSPSPAPAPRPGRSFSAAAPAQLRGQNRGTGARTGGPELGHGSDNNRDTGAITGIRR